MDYEILRETLRVTLDEVAFRVDENDNTTNVSILGKAQEDLKSYLEENTSISDDEKAKRYSEFLTSVITSVTTQAIIVAGDAPFKSIQADELQKETTQKIASMVIDDQNKTAETNQKIISMQNDDKAKLNNSAVNVAKAKADIETLLPAQVAQINADILLKDAQVLNEQKRLLIMDKDLEIKGQDLLLKQKSLLMEDKKIELAAKDIELKAKDIELKVEEIPLKQAQVSIEEKRLELMDKDLEIKGQDLSLKEKSLIMEDKKIELAAKDIEMKTQEIQNETVRNQILLSQAAIEKQKIGLTMEQIRLAGAEVQYKLAQLVAIQQAATINKEIEAEKNKTQIEIAEIYALGR